MDHEYFWSYPFTSSNKTLIIAFAVFVAIKAIRTKYLTGLEVFVSLIVYCTIIIFYSYAMCVYNIPSLFAITNL